MSSRKIEGRYLIIIILVVVILSLGIISLSIKNNHNKTMIEKCIKDTSVFFVKVLNIPINILMNGINESLEKRDLYDKYVDMKEDYKTIDVLRAKYSEAKKESDELSGLLELNSKLSDNSYLNATIVSRNMGYWYNIVEIDKGANNGVELGNAVVTTEGLIGKIISTSNFSSTVKLLTTDDTNSKISVKIESDNEYVYGLLVGYNQDEKVFIIEGISGNSEIKENSIVTTTGLGDNYPSGILIGRVTKILKDNFDLARTVWVKSEVNFDGISYVTILKRGEE